ncbi:MAG TPA: hypothetical protein VFU47_08020, partial [Armatimonadota bacterium]|nr:hypothetical protein [Armatimonadota bacterium]
AQIDAEPDAGRKAELQREMDAQWYLADKLGEVLASNPDLRLDIVFQRYFPTEFQNDLQRHFWVRSIPWILEHQTPAPTQAEPAKTGHAGTDGASEEAPAAAAPPDPRLVMRDRALQVYLDALRPEALPQTRAAAVRLANSTSVRRNPEVILALKKLLEFEKDPQLRKIAENVVKQGDERFIPDLIAALRAENRPGKWLTADGQVEPAVLQDITFFRDYVTPELARVKRSDQVACLGCHGVPGRVPSFTLKPVDEYGYISVPDLLFNYRETQARVNLADVEKSKILRKPLNIQDGKEDGHQGGRRYLPQDEGYLLLKKWAENQPKLLQPGMSRSVEPLFRLFARERAKAIRPRLPSDAS